MHSFSRTNSWWGTQGKLYQYILPGRSCRFRPPIRSGTFFLVYLGGVRLSPLGTSATVGLLHQPRMIDDDYGAVGGMRIGKGNRSTRRKPAPVPFCPPQIPHDLTWDRTRAAAVGNQRLTAWAMARPDLVLMLALEKMYRPIGLSGISEWNHKNSTEIVTEGIWSFALPNYICETAMYITLNWLIYWTLSTVYFFLVKNNFLP
jgi:hypothetical protein